jgi:D-glycero-alpha-D-manno-heptose-7-phosphate kinase
MQNQTIAITKTPLRVSLIGGGTDMPYFYNKFGGATISFAIKKYIYVFRIVWDL